MANEDVLFTVTKENLETGMRGYPVGYCTTSTVDPVKGLFYVGHPVSEMTDWEPERVIFLLLYGFDGSPKEIDALKHELKSRSQMHSKVRESIRKLPREGHPMRIFSMALQILGIYEGTGDWREDCLNVAAKIPYVAAEVILHHAGWGDVKTPKATGYMESLAEMLAVKGADLELLTEALRLFNILHLDHGGGNLSTFVGKATSSSLEDLYGSLSSAMCALAGPRHGRANQDCLEFVQGVLNALGEHATPEMVEEYIRKLLDRGELVFGFGHAVLRVEDPRAEVFYNLAKKRYHSHPLVKIALLIRDSGKKVLRENEKISDPNPNVDAISGIVLAAAGFPYPDYFTVLFGMARVIGIGRQIVYERVEAREGKGTPIVRPKYIYKAPEPHIFGLKIDT